MNDNEQLDNILNEALSEYREAEPLAGLEDRVLQRLRLQPEDRRISWRTWRAIAACAATLAIVAWLGWRGHGTQNQVARQPVEARSTSAPPPTEGPAHSTRTDPSTSASHSLNQLQAKSERSVGRRSSTDIRQTHAVVHNADGREYLHQPTPLTGEERQLLALALTHPDALRAISQEGQPITITPLTIQPLPSEANQNGDN